MIVFTKFEKFMEPIQKEYIQIPIFHDCIRRCDSKGRTDKTNPIKSPMGVMG